MAAGSFAVLISDTLKRHIDGLARPELERLREKFEFLSSGLWEGGLRVKKLKNSKAVVFEARISKGDRLLFTLGRESGETRLYAWGIERHDDVNRAKAAILPESAPFLSFEAVEVEESADLDLEGLDPDYYSQEAFEAVAAEDCGPQRWRLVEDEDWGRLLARAEKAEIDLRLHLTTTQRTVLAAPPPLLLSGTAGSGKTTIAVYYLFRALPGVERRLFVTWHPFLKSYSERLYDSLAAGTGGARRERPRFAVWRDIVLEVATRGARPNSPFRDPSREADLAWFERSLRERKEFSDLDPELAWEEIRGIIKGAKPPIDPATVRRLVTAFGEGALSGRDRRELGAILEAVANFEFLPKIEAIIERRGAFANYGDLLRSIASPSSIDRAEFLVVLRQILDQLEKRKADLGRPLLSFAEYQALGKKRAPRFAHDRATIYAAAEWYEGRISELGLWDDIDLARAALSVIGKGGGGGSAEGGFAAAGSASGESAAAGTAEIGAAAVADELKAGIWDLVVCDEAQDFANVHFQLMFRLVADPRQVVLAGDVKQTINPSGFRWADLRALFYEKGIQPPELFHLDLNFRSVGGIVALGNALLDLKKRLAGIQSDESKERWKFQGLMPCLLAKADASALASAIPSTGAADAIIVRDARTRDEVKSLVGTEFVFTISESKGLEFDSTLLWNIMSGQGEISGLWRRVSADPKAAIGFEARVAHEINLLYVAVTRARNGLVIFDTDAAFWGLEEFAGLFVPSDEVGVVAAYWTKISGPEEWRGRGDYYAERRHWLAAAECYRNAGDPTAEARARGLGLLENERFAEAAPLLATAGLGAEAAGAWEKASDFRAAATIWTDLGEAKRAARCSALSLEKEGSWAAAAAAWLALKDRKAAARTLARAEYDPSAGDLYRSLKLWDKAAQAYARAGRHLDAAECWRKAGKQAKAADSYAAAGDWESALRYYRLSRNRAKEAECVRRLGRHDILAKQSLKSKDGAEAIRFFKLWLEDDTGERRSALLAEAETWVKRNAFEAAVRFAALGEAERAAALFSGASRHELALAEYLSLGDHARASNSLWYLQRYAEAAKERELAGLNDRHTVDHFRRSVEIGYEKLDRAKAEALVAEADALKASGEDQHALNRYLAANRVDACIPLFRRLPRDEEAFAFLARRAAYDELESLIAGKPDFRLSHEYVMGQSPALRDYYFRGNADRATLDILACVLRGKGRGDRSDPAFRAEVDSILPFADTSIYKEMAKRKRLDIVDGLIGVGHHNALYLAWRFAPDDPDSRAFGDGLVDRLETAAKVQGPDALLHASLASFMAKRKSEAAPPISGIDLWNTVVYFLNATTDPEVFDWYILNGHFEELDSFVKLLKVEGSAATRLEEKREFLRAEAYYSKVERFGDALRVALEAKDFPGCAKIFEKSGNLDQALDIWKQLGNAKDAARVEKAIARKKKRTERDDDGQLELL